MSAEEAEIKEALNEVSNIEDRLTDLSTLYGFEYEITTYEERPLDKLYPTNVVRIKVRKRLR